MFVKTLFLLILSILAIAQPQPQDEGKKGKGGETDPANTDPKSIDVSKLENRIEFIQFDHHTGGNKEGEILTVKISPPTPEIAAKAEQLVKSFSIAIGTGTGTAVDNEFFMESEKFPYPTNEFEYSFQLPQPMEGKNYCIVYTPFGEDGTNKPDVDGVPMESLYEEWFPIEGSLAEGTGPKNALNEIANPVSSQANVQDGDDGAQTERQVQGNDSQTSSSFNISPAFTAFIAILFACFFI